MLPQGRLFQHKSVPEPEEMDETMAIPSDHSKEEAKESPPEKSDIDKLKESLQEREEKEADLKQALEIAETEIQQHRAELDDLKTELQTVKNKLQEINKKVTEIKSRDIWNLKSTVSQHSSDIERFSNDLKTRSLEEENKRLVSQQSTTKQIGEVQSSIKSEIRKHMQSQIPEHKKELAQQLRVERKTEMGEMKREMLDMQREVLKQHEEREEASFLMSVKVLSSLIEAYP